VLKAKSPFTNQSYSVKSATANDDLQSNKTDNAESTNFITAANREYYEEDFGGEEEDPEWVDIDVKDIENNKIDFQPVPQTNISNNKIQENFEKENDLNKSDEKDTKEDEDALTRLGKISCKNKIQEKIISSENKNISTKQENTNQEVFNISAAQNKVLDVNELFEIGKIIKEKEELICNNNDEANSDEKNNEDINFNENVLQSALAGLNFFDIFINENNTNQQENKSLEGLDEALMKNMFVSQNSINSGIFNSNGQNDLFGNSPDKHDILLKTLNFTSELQKNIFQGTKESLDIEAENQLNLDSDEQTENSFDKAINSHRKDSENATLNNYPEINKDLFERFNQQLKMRGINPENFNLNMANASFNNMIFNNNENNNIAANLNKPVNNSNNNSNQNKNIMNNHMINNRMNIPQNAIPNIIQAPNMIPYPLLNREMIINNMIQQGLIKPNMNLNAQRQNISPHQMQYLENLKNRDRDKNSGINKRNSVSESYKDKSLIHQNFLENPITVVEKNLIKKGWAIMDDKNKPHKFLNSVELQSYLEAEKKKNNCSKMNFICDYESDMYFKPADLLEELQETMPRLIENLNAKNQQQKMQTAAPMIHDIRMMGFPMVNPVAMQNIDKENPAFKIPGMPININPLMLDQRIVNMNMIPHHLPQFANVMGNTFGGVNNINNCFNGHAVNMNINLQFVNNDIKLNNIMVGNSANVNNNNINNTEDNNDLPNTRNINNININKKDSSSNNSAYNVNMIPPGFNKNVLQSLQKGQNIQPVFPINPNFNMAAVNNTYFSSMNQMMQNNPNNKSNANNFGNNNPSGQNAMNINNDLQDNFSNTHNETINKKGLNSFFGSNVFYESIKPNQSNNKLNDQMKSDRNFKANVANNAKSNKTTEPNKPSNLSQTVSFKGNTNNKKNQNNKK